MSNRTLADAFLEDDPEYRPVFMFGQSSPDYPAPVDSAESFVDQTCDFYRAARAMYGPSEASRQTTRLVQDRLAVVVTGTPRPPQDFWARELRQYWDDVSDSYHETARDIGKLLRDDNISDARCALAAILDIVVLHDNEHPQS